MQILESFKHAATFAQMSLGEKLIASLYVTLLGMGITFVALVIIWGISALMSKIIIGIESKNKSAVTVAAKPSTPVAEAVAVEEDNEEELVVVITAAIAAALGTSMHNIVVKGITRVEDATPVWGRAGRNDVMNSRF